MPRYLYEFTVAHIASFGRYRLHRRLNLESQPSSVLLKFSKVRLECSSRLTSVAISCSECSI